MIVLPSTKPDPADALVSASRKDLTLVLIDGRPLVGSPAFEVVFGTRRTSTRPLCVDGAERVADAMLARTIAKCPIREPGVEVI